MTTKFETQQTGQAEVGQGATCRCEGRKRCRGGSGVAGSDCTSLPEEQLGCRASVIDEINEAEAVAPFTLMTAQIFVQKATEK